jgi:hypothetical protein
MTSPHDQQPDPQRSSGDHSREIKPVNIIGNTGPVAVGWNIIQKILHVELPIEIAATTPERS